MKLGHEGPAREITVEPMPSYAPKVEPKPLPAPKREPVKVP